MAMAFSRSGDSAQAIILAVAPVAVETTMGMLHTPAALMGRRRSQLEDRERRLRQLQLRAA